MADDVDLNAEPAVEDLTVKEMVDDQNPDCFVIVFFRPWRNTFYPGRYSYIPIFLNTYFLSLSSRSFPLKEAFYITEAMFFP